MPEELSKEVVNLLTYLLPGFLVGWIFYSLTNHQKPTQFERIIQALIFTLIISFFVVLERIALIFVGQWFQLRPWDKDAELIASVLSALSFGFFISYLTNKDSLHRCLRRFGFSQRSGSANEWCTVFSPREQFVVVQLKDERRLYGWPKVWPSDPQKGHLFITLASWVHGAEPVELTEAEGVLIDVKDIAHLEFVKQPQESS
jgi:hypothetical protein